MQLENKFELLKKLDENECRLNASTTAPIQFLIASCDDFKAYLVSRLEEITKQQNSSNEAVKVVSEKVEPIV